MKFGELITEFSNDEQHLNEIKMSSTTLNDFMKSDAAKIMLMGFEAELVYRGMGAADGDYTPDPEIDYDIDETPRSIDQVVDFFAGNSEEASWEQRENAEMTNSHRSLTLFRERLEENYKSSRSDYFQHKWDNELSDREIYDVVREFVLDEDQFDPEQFIETYIAEYFDGNDSEENRLEAESVASERLQEYIEEAIKKENDTYDEARQRWLDDQITTDEYSEEEWFDSSGYDSMRAIDRDSSLSRAVRWPYYYYPEEEDTSGNEYDEGNATQLAQSLQRRLSNFWDEYDKTGRTQPQLPGMPSNFPYNVKASSGYHNTSRTPTKWIFEPDGSITADDGDMPAELISPPMPLSEGIDTLRVFLEWARDNDAYSNSTTGLHVGISISGLQDKVDYLKLALLLGDEYVLERFDRQVNHYCSSAVNKISNKIGNMPLNEIENIFDQMKRGLGTIAKNAIVANNTDKYVSINMKEDYIEFRSMGGGRYLDEDMTDTVLDTIKRFAYVTYISSQPNLHEDSYMAKLREILLATKQGKKVVKYYDPRDPRNSKQPTILSSDKKQGMIPFVMPSNDDITGIFMSYAVSKDIRNLKRSLDQRLQSIRKKELEKSKAELTQNISDTSQQSQSYDPSTDLTYIPPYDADGEYGIFRAGAAPESRIGDNAAFIFNAPNMTLAKEYSNRWLNRRRWNTENYAVYHILGHQSGINL